MTHFEYFSGEVTSITDFWTGSEPPTGCYKLFSVTDRSGSIVNFVVSPTTYFVDHEMINLGDLVIGFYDGLAPVPLIYPPQYRAIVMARIQPTPNIKVDYFDSQLVSSDGRLKLNIGPFTQIVLENDQAFTQNPANHDLVVLYGPTTRSIPAQTTPYKIIVLCRNV